MGSGASTEKTNTNKWETKSKRGNVIGSLDSDKSETCKVSNHLDEISKDRDDDSCSVDSKNSDDTVALAHRLPKYIAAHAREMQDDAIEIIAKENKTCYTISIENDLLKYPNVDESKATNAKTIDNIKEMSVPRKVTFEVDTIGYYIAKSDLEANEDLDRSNVNKKTDVGQVLNEQVCEHNATAVLDTNYLYEEFKLNYSSRSRLVHKRTVSNKQTIVLSKVGNRYKYITVPAYLPGQRLYNSRSFVKNYMTSSQYVYRRGKRKGMPFFSSFL